MGRLPPIIFKICGKDIRKKCGNPRSNKACASDVGKKCFAKEMKARGIKRKS